MEVMGIYSSCFSFMLKYIYIDEEYSKWLETVVSGDPDKLCPESLLKYHLIKNEININYIDSLTEHYVNFIFN